MQTVLALIVPDHIAQVGHARHDLRCHAPGPPEQPAPAQDHEAPVQRRGEEFIDEPERMAPLVEPHIGQDHQRPHDRPHQGKRDVLAELRQPGHRIQVTRDATRDVEREGEVEGEDMAGGEARIADDHLVPGRILLQGITPRPVHAKDVNREPHHPIKIPLELRLGVHVGHVTIPRTPNPPQGRGREDDVGNHVKAPQTHPDIFEFRRHRVQTM